ncbi:MAG: hypothetical protein ACTHMT_04605, partial [Verrucomicrobiota bacterium]
RYGQTTAPESLNDAVAIAAGYLHSVALRSNGTVTAWGDNTFGQTNVPTSLSNVVAIAAGDFHSYALQKNGQIVSWGDNTYGQANVTISDPGATSVSSGSYHGLALIPALPGLVAQPSGNGLTIQWVGGGILQWAPTPTGPFNDIIGATSGYTNTSVADPMKFFRLRK